MWRAFRCAWMSVCAGIFGLATAGDAAGPPQLERDLSRSRDWANVKFAGKKPEAAGLFVAANHDPVQANGRGGKALRIGEKQSARGLYCHAPSRIVVRLPGAARRFQAEVGVDSNEQTSGGRGNVIFSVSAGGKTLYSSDLVREGMAAIPVDVDLGGATEFELAVADGGDGISCDQADWAEARATLSDGRELALGELPIFDEPPYTAELPFSFVYRGKTSAALLPTWTTERKSEEIDEAHATHGLLQRSRDGVAGAMRRGGVSRFSRGRVDRVSEEYRGDGDATRGESRRAGRRLDARQRRRLHRTALRRLAGGGPRLCPAGHAIAAGQVAATCVGRRSRQ